MRRWQDGECVLHWYDLEIQVSKWTLTTKTESYIQCAFWILSLLYTTRSSSYEPYRHLHAHSSRTAKHGIRPIFHFFLKVTQMEKVDSSTISSKRADPVCNFWRRFSIVMTMKLTIEMWKKKKKKKKKTEDSCASKQLCILYFTILIHTNYILHYYY